MFIQFDSSDTLQLLGSLSAETQPLWGGMTAQHMAEHLTDLIRISSGLIEMRQVTSAEKLIGLRRFLLSTEPLPRNVALPDGMKLPPLRKESLSAALGVMTDSVQKFHEIHAQQANLKPVHPYFGPLSYREWQIFHNKHFTHHLSQFGLIQN